MKVIFAIPAYDGTLEAGCVLSLTSSVHLLQKLDIEYDISILSGCALLSVARNTLVSMFMETDATDLFFIDSDVGFPPEGVVKLLRRDEGVVGGVYPFKRDGLSFPAMIKTEDGVPIGRQGQDKEDQDNYLIEADGVPAGFLRIKRRVIEKMLEAYPQLNYNGDPLAISDTARVKGCDLFNVGASDGTRWMPEDYAFCERWIAIGGQVWVYPNLEFEHVGKKSYKGNYHEYLLGGGR